MKMIGILGGMSVASTQIYYRELARLTRDRLGGLHSPELLIRSVDFDRIAKLQAASDWVTAGQVLNAEARALERGGAQLLLLATNTMHKVADQIVEGIEMPLLHIADATADIIASRGLQRPGLMATAFTMEQSFYIDRLKAKDLIPLVPNAEDRAETHRIIYEELCRDVIKDDSRTIFETIAKRLVARGCDCLILGCTEIGMLLSQENVSVPVFDTTLIHCEAALSAALT
ncbi:aspartate/glutamate racemase family protein [Agrobacterium bohemicum]|uniref:Aspartate racemase n=1 Tax=Agrobacterium bohemicum TaxID=2052828 RepID=A0A135P7D3_9HYPH|nr:aspartate/glutamate racemase family protein [Agrobacterium bohemicum]KXG87331.1 aspartate racemase [Agrobacterium bohemicum]